MEDMCGRDMWEGVLTLTGGLNDLGCCQGSARFLVQKFGQGQRHGCHPDVGTNQVLVYWTPGICGCGYCVLDISGLGWKNLIFIKTLKYLRQDAYFYIFFN